jgi:integrase
MSYSKQAKAEGTKLVLNRMGNYWRAPRTNPKDKPKYFKGDDTQAGYIAACASYQIWKDETDNADIGRVPLTPIEVSRDGLQTLTKNYLYRKLQQVERGERSPKTYGSILEQLKFLELFFGNKSIRKFDETSWTDFYNSVAEKEFSNLRKRNILQTARTFLNDCYTEGFIPTLPRNLTKYKFDFQIVHSAKDLWTKEEIKKTLQTISPRLKVFLLLGLNCAMTQGDFAAIQKTNVDLKNGRLIYQRVKTKRRKGPIVNYKLWPITVKALQENMSEHKTLFFTTDENNPLVSSKVVDTKFSGWDTISKKWDDARKAKTIPNKKLKFLRKTGASLIGQNPKYAPLVHLFLADKNKSIAWTNYIVLEGQPIAGLDEAVDWLGGELGLI